MRVLIVGGGVAGLTLAAKLLQQGRRPVIVEKAHAFEDKGYAIGLYPLGSCVLHGLGKYDELIERGQVADSYRIVDGRGGLMQDVDLSIFAGEIGPMVLISRTELIDLLQDAAGDADVRMGTTVSELHQPNDSGLVDVVLSDGTPEAFDVVIGCDGIHSPTRSMVFDAPADVFDSNWVLWVWWSEMPAWPRNEMLESWGKGRFFGLYPVADRVMVCAGMNENHITVEPTDLQPAKSYLHELFAEFSASDERIGSAIDSSTRFFSWRMADARAHEWVNGRVGLCGDAAVGFLPTAGAGANSAMRSAAALADELSRVNGQTASLALEMFEKRCRKIVEKNQKDSRRLAKYIFVENAMMAWSRNELVKHYPVAKMVGDIVDAMHTPF